MGLRNVVSKRLGLLVAGAALVLGMMAATAPAEARSRHRHYSKHRVHATWHVKRYVHVRKRHGVRARRVAVVQMPAEYVMDVNSGRVLHAHNENVERHPASLTKVMTLYLLFEQLEAGRIRLGSEIPISAHAAAQAPSKLGLRPGSSIEVEDAIKSIVTKSANDIAVAIGEAVGGSEDRFAEMMTRKAHALGMSRTNYANASGLPNSEQITTARDQAILAKAIQERFPKYYRYFSTRIFNFAGRSIRNHNHLLGRVEGVDGIKTGYTVKAGFNLMTSVRRDGHHIVGVVLGGRTARSRDARMASLVENNIDDGAVGRTAVAMAEKAEVARPVIREEVRPIPKDEPVRVAAAEPMRLMPPAQIESVRAQAAPARAEAYAPRPQHARADAGGLFLGVPPAPIPNRADAERPRPAYVSGVARVAETSVDRPAEKIKLRAVARTPAAAVASATPSSLRWVTGAQPARKGEGRDVSKETAKAGHSQVAKAQPKKVDDEETTATVARTGWIIQIGATDDIAKAKELLSRAKGHSRTVAKAQPFTEKVKKGSETLWRARFAGLQENAAESACRELKRSGMACFAMRN
ncbi:MAG: serine hydrolase [Methylobacteriaceae bacterium]|nr:serine hydrolase [Methylobacteriaceae bacterium]MCO5088633.1 serine hydrolase [Methylobacteriaceae bacterium]HPG02458.1 serine hydrolase [Rhodoblastus sp.]